MIDSIDISEIFEMFSRGLRCSSDAMRKIEYEKRGKAKSGNEVMIAAN